MVLDCLLIGYNSINRAVQRRAEMKPGSMGKLAKMKRADSHERIFWDGEWRTFLDAVSYARQGNGHPGETTPGGSPLLYSIQEPPPLAAVYLANFLTARGLKAEWINCFDLELERLAEVLRVQRPAVTAITTTYYSFASPTFEIVRFVRLHNPDTKIVLGGQLLWKNVMHNASPAVLSKIFELIDADVYVVDEQGEASLAKIVRAVVDGSGLADIPNLYVRSAGGRFSGTRREPENNVLDENYIQWERFPQSDIGSVVSTRTALGCAYRCSFCNFPVMGGGLRWASVETVERELMGMKKMGVTDVTFIDDTFNIPAERFEDICRMMIRNRFEFRWYSFFRCANVRNKETFRLMKESGCKGVYLGVESADPSILTNMNKSAAVEKYIWGIEQLHENGIFTYASLICGFPGETTESVDKTIRFIESSAPTFIRPTVFFYEHATSIYRDREKYGLVGEALDWKHNTMDSHAALDVYDYLVRTIKNSVPVPTDEFDFFGMPYAISKGFTVESLRSTARAFSELCVTNCLKDAASKDIQLFRSTQESRFSQHCRTLDLAPPKFRRRSLLYDGPENTRPAWFKEAAAANAEYVNVLSQA